MRSGKLLALQRQFEVAPPFKPCMLVRRCDRLILLVRLQLVEQHFTPG